MLLLLITINKNRVRNDRLSSTQINPILFNQIKRYNYIIMRMRMRIIKVIRTDQCWNISWRKPRRMNYCTKIMSRWGWKWKIEEEESKWGRLRKRTKHVDIVADGIDLLVGLLAQPIGAHLVQYLIHFSIFPSNPNFWVFIFSPMIPVDRDGRET